MYYVFEKLFARQAMLRMVTHGADNYIFVTKKYLRVESPFDSTLKKILDFTDSN